MTSVTRLIVLAALACLVCAVPARAQQLPGAATPAQAAAYLAAPPAGLEIVDIRPAAEYADYSLPGSINLDPAAVLADETLLTGSGPLLIVDKDGTGAFAVAGMLAAKAKRPVLAVSGGMKALWAERELGMAVKEVPLAPASPASAPGSAPAVSPQSPQAPAAPALPSQPATPTPAPVPPALKDAGC